jgi:hypothetical protein
VRRVRNRGLDAGEVSGLMPIWNLIKRLVADRSTLARALGEIESSRLIGDITIHSRHLSTVLVAGGGRHSRGSESLLLEVLERDLPPCRRSVN